MALPVVPMERVVAVVPALDEEASVASVVTGLREIVDVVVVVDDGSTDETAAVARAAGAVVVRHGRNLGVGAAIATGLATAVDLDATLAVQLDGDGQHDVAYVGALVQAVRDGADLVVGTRFELGFEMSVARRIMLRVFAKLIERRISVPISDPTSGFRAFSARAIAALTPVFPVKYLSDTVEILFLAHERDLRIVTVPVTMRQRVTGEASVGPLRGIGYTMRILTVIGRHSLRTRARG